MANQQQPGNYYPQFHAQDTPQEVREAIWAVIDQLNRLEASLNQTKNSLNPTPLTAAQVQQQINQAIQEFGAKFIPVASTTRLGIVQIGQGLSITATGLLSSNAVTATVWSPFSPSITPGGSMTFTVGTNSCRFLQVGKITYVTINITGTIGGTPSNFFHFGPPINGFAGEQYALAGFGVDGGGTAFVPFAVVLGSFIQLSKSDGTNFTTGSSAAFTLTGVYESA